MKHVLGGSGRGMLVNAQCETPQADFSQFLLIIGPTYRNCARARDLSNSIITLVADDLVEVANRTDGIQCPTCPKLHSCPTAPSSHSRTTPHPHHKTFHTEELGFLRRTGPSQGLHYSRLVGQCPLYLLDALDESGTAIIDTTYQSL